MVEERAQRRLAAILAADVVGYSRLMELHDVGTFERPAALIRNELFEPRIGKHQGRIFKLMGDGLLAEFASVVDAVEMCRCPCRKLWPSATTGLAENHRIRLAGLALISVT